MSGDVAMSSDDEKPIGLKRAQNGHNGHVASNGNGRAVDESSMSEDDDMPLVCRVSYLWERSTSHAVFVARLTTPSRRPPASSPSP